MALAQIKGFMSTKSQFILKFNYQNLLLTFYLWLFFSLSRCPETRNNCHKMQTWLPKVTSNRVIYRLIGYLTVWYHSNSSSLWRFNLYLSFIFCFPQTYCSCWELSFISIIVILIYPFLDMQHCLENTCHLMLWRT